MFDQKVLDPERFPVPDNIRKSTDVICTIIGALFAITLFVLSFCLFNKQNFLKIHKYTDSQGNLCSQYLTYPNINDLSIRRCIDSCPDATTAKTTYSGSICLPNDQAARNKVLKDKFIEKSFNKQRFTKTVFYVSIIALGIGLLWIALVHCIPRLAPILAYAAAILLLIAIGVILLIDNSGFWRGPHGIKIGVAVFCFVLAIIIIIMLALYSSEVKFQGIFLEYATKFLNENLCLFSYIPFFLLLTFGLIVLNTWQIAAFRSAYATSNSLWQGGALQILSWIQFFWGLQFLRDSFNFCISGTAVQWYWNGRSSCYPTYQRLVCKNWGSVVGGSFLNAFFEIPTLLVQLLVCHPETCCAKCGTFCYNSCNCCTCFFNLVRTDAYSYINLSGIPFCNSARQCQKLCDNTNHFVGRHSSLKHYRFVAHVKCIAAVFLSSYFILRYRLFDYNDTHLISLVIWAFVIVTYFIGIHADSAQGLQVSFLSENQLEIDYSYMQKCLPSVRKQLGFLSTRIKGDGTCGQ